MDIALLTTFLAPFLGALIHAGQAALDAAVTRGGSEAIDHAHGLWQRMRGKVEQIPEAEEAASKLADRPGSTRRQRAFAGQLEVLLAGDEELAHDVEALWARANAAGVVVASGDRSVAVGGNVSGGAIVTGDNVSVEQ